MSILITFVSNITVLVSHKIIFFGFFKPMSHGINKKTSTLHVSCPHLHLPTRFLPGFFGVVQEILYQPYFTMIRLFMKDNKFSKKVRFFLLVHGWLILILLFCSYVFFTAHFFSQFCHHEIMNLKLLLFFGFRGNQVWDLHYLHNFKLLISFQECKERII